MLDLWRAQEIGLAQRCTFLPHNVIGGSDMEVEVRDGPVGNVDRTLELEFPARNLNTDLDVLFALESILLALSLTQELHGTCNALLELLGSGLIVFDGHPLEATDAGEHALRDIAGELDLECEREHILGNSGLSQLLKRDIVLLGPVLGLRDVAGERSETADEERNAWYRC